MRSLAKLFKKRLSKKQISMIVGTVLLAAGTYLLITILAPSVPPTPAPKTKVQAYFNSPPKSHENRLYIPAINVDVAIAEGKTSTALNEGAWHRRPENGDPEKGSNFVLSAHRFELGFTPQHTKARSPFYHIDKLKPGDTLYVDFNQKRYTYEVTKKYKVPRTAVEIEGPSAEPKMTLYSCDLRGEAAGREVVEAKPSS